jgi:DNA helicase-2/ATP-dependent DNA helicase PcrA
MPLQRIHYIHNSVVAFLEYTDSFQDETVGDDKEGVSLMTVHKAKGLEFKICFVIGMVEGLMPSGKGKHP